MKTYLLLRNNKQSGPYTLDEMLTMGLRSQDLIWIEGKSASWRYPSELDEFKGQVAAPVLEDPLDIGFTQVQNTIVHSMPPSVLPAEPAPALEMNGFPTLSSFMRESGDRETAKRPLIFVAADTVREVPSAVFQTLAGTDDSLDAMPTMAWQSTPPQKVENSDQPLSLQGSRENTALADAPETAKPLLSKILVTLPAAVPDKTLVVIGRKAQPAAAPQPSKPLIRRPVLEFIIEQEQPEPMLVDASSDQPFFSAQAASTPPVSQDSAEPDVVLQPMSSEIVETQPLEAMDEMKPAAALQSMSSEIVETQPLEALDEMKPAAALQPMSSEIVETKPVEAQDQMGPAVLHQSLPGPMALPIDHNSVSADEDILRQVHETVSNQSAITGQSNASGLLPVLDTPSASVFLPGLSDGTEVPQEQIRTEASSVEESVSGGEEATDSLLANLAVTVPSGEAESSSTLRVNIRTIQKVAVTAAILSLIAVAVLVANSIFNPDAYNYQNLPQQHTPVKADTQPVRDEGTGTTIEKTEGQKNTDAGTSSNQQSQSSSTDESGIVPVVNHEK